MEKPHRCSVTIDIEGMSPFLSVKHKNHLIQKPLHLWPKVQKTHQFGYSVKMKKAFHLLIH